MNPNKELRNGQTVAKGPMVLFKYRTKTKQLGHYDCKSEYECCEDWEKKN